MNKLKHMAVVACLSLWAAASHATVIPCDATAGNLVQNCGFESGDFSSWALSGADVPGDLNNLYGVEFGTDPDGNDPHGGSYQAWFGDFVANPLTLAQTLATKAGDQYLVSFYLAQDGSPPDKGYSAPHLQTSFGGTSLNNVTAVPMQAYTEYAFLVYATSASSLLSLTLGNDTGYFLLDDVSVVDQTPGVAVPEPNSLALVGVGLLAFFTMRSRRRGRQR